MTGRGGDGESGRGGGSAARGEEARGREGKAERPLPGAKVSWEEIYAEIARLPLPDRQRLVARLLLDLASEAAGAALPLRDAAPTANDEPPTTGDSRRPLAPSPSRPLAPGSRPSASPLPKAGTAHPRLIVDGSNFLGTVPGFDLASARSRDKLILRLQEYARRHLATRVVVFFDGKSASATVQSGVEIRFSPAAKTADQQIVAFLRSIPKGERDQALLVTEDVELAERARALGVRVEAPLRFRARIPDPPRPPSDRGLSPAEVAEWEEYFRKGRNR